MCLHAPALGPVSSSSCWVTVAGGRDGWGEVQAGEETSPRTVGDRLLHTLRCAPRFRPPPFLHQRVDPCRWAGVRSGVKGRCTSVGCHQSRLPGDPQLGDLLLGVWVL